MVKFVAKESAYDKFSESDFQILDFEKIHNNSEHRSWEDWLIERGIVHSWLFTERLIPTSLDERVESILLQMQDFSIFRMGVEDVGSVNDKEPFDSIIIKKNENNELTQVKESSKLLLDVPDEGNAMLFRLWSEAKINTNM